MADDGQYATFTLIMNIEEIPTQDRVYYFDDIAIGDATCANPNTSIFDVNVAALKVYPNPVQEELIVEDAEGIRQFAVLNLMGQTMQRIQIDGQRKVNINMSELPKGMYILAGYDESGRLMANARITKQ